MTITLRIPTLAALPFILLSLLSRMFCPLMTGLAAAAVFGPGLPCTAATVACFTWGAWHLREWWGQVNCLLLWSLAAAPRRAPCAR